MLPEKVESWKIEQKKFWKTKPNASTTKEFFDTLVKGGWKCGACEMPRNPNAWMGGGMLNLLPPAFTYFKDKEIAAKKQEERKMSIHIEKLENSGTFIAGDAINSTFSVDNSVKNIEKKIEEDGGADKEVLFELLEEVKELIENIESSRSIPKQKGLFKRISEHMTTHGWFYAEIIALLGQTALQMIGG